MLFSLVLSTASAGKLAEGFRGVPYGPATALDVAPGDSCASSTEVGVRWLCQVHLGEAEVQVAYMVKEGLFYGLVMRANEYTNASAFFDVLVAGYGPGSPENTYDDSRLADRMWRDGSVIGSWGYNKFSDLGQFIVFDQTAMAKIKATENERAKAAAGGL